MGLYDYQTIGGSILFLPEVGASAKVCAILKMRQTALVQMAIALQEQMASACATMEKNRQEAMTTLLAILGSLCQIQNRQEATSTLLTLLGSLWQVLAPPLLYWIVDAVWVRTLPVRVSGIDAVDDDAAVRPLVPYRQLSKGVDLTTKTREHDHDGSIMIVSEGENGGNSGRPRRELRPRRKHQWLADGGTAAQLADGGIDELTAGRVDDEHNNSSGTAV